jgi:hypothetical protein
MKPSFSLPTIRRPGRRRGEQAGLRLALLALLFLVLGFAGGAYWRYRATHPATGETGNSSDQTSGLSDATVTVLKRLNGPVEIRFYSLLDPGADDSLKDFSRRVDRLLAAYQNAANGKLTVIRHDSQANDSTAAFNDGLTPFNLDKGDACYLGVAAQMGSSKESLPRLLPEWEQAVEPDVTRAIARLLDAAQPPGAAIIASTPAAASAVDAVKRAIPDIASTSLEDGTKLLRAAAFQEFAMAANEMNAQIKDAQQRLSQAQAAGSDTDQQAAMKNLEDVQKAQSAKLQDLAAQSQARIDAFKRLKQPPK